MDIVDTLIVGGGPAGSAAAIMLARDGARPLLLERDREPGDALCGGFLSWRTLASLQRLGVDAHALGGAPIGRVRIASGRRVREARLPAAGVGLSRRALDAALIARAGAAGAGIERGVAVRAAEPGGARLADGGRIGFGRLLLATGKHELRGLARPRDPHAAIGLRFRLAPTPALAAMLAGTIELHLFAGGYAGLLLQEEGGANLCMAIAPARLAEAGGDPRALLDMLAARSPLLTERLVAAGGIGPAQAIAGVPYGWRARIGAAGLYRLGDQAAVIPSLAGEGVGIALASGARAAQAIAAGEGGERFQPRLAAALATPLRTAVALSRLAARPGVAGAALALLPPALLPLMARLTRVPAARRRALSLVGVGIEG